ncbi:hypothetical protein [Noviherbaspirillum denitrificans]|uniref:Uncharacterized protein n=1 Tax=Noviherbaspirillum denitrificans TaxID=1968433 RepID=A0A254TM85_9BURK|nr:hypothetical protein [Noviherbaspirillum denitrificans]OWW22452.1 hypothetical protein AYR66_26095 [Noviherbaspirillum denitrificans]
MSRENDVSAVLQQYAAETGVHSVQKVEQDFVAVAQHVPAEHVTTGLAEAMHSEQTPPFEDMVGEAFERGSDELRVSMLRQLIDGASPAVLKPLIDDGQLPRAANGSGSPAVPIDAALVQDLDVDVVRRLARGAAQEDASVIDRMSEFFAVDPAAGKTLGGAALSVALGKIAEAR